MEGGEVWKVEAPGGLEKAIKFVYGHLDEIRAEREMKALNRIKDVRHPFLLSLERIEVVEGQLIIVTELADASLKDLYDELRKSEERGIPRDKLLVYLGDAADALDYIGIGEGEHTIVELTRALEGRMDLRDVRGLALRDRDTGKSRGFGFVTGHELLILEDHGHVLQGSLAID